MLSVLFGRGYGAILFQAAAILCRFPNDLVPELFGFKGCGRITRDDGLESSHNERIVPSTGPLGELE